MFQSSGSVDSNVKRLEEETDAKIERLKEEASSKSSDVGCLMFFVPCPFTVVYIFMNVGRTLLANMKFLIRIGYSSFNLASNSESGISRKISYA